MDATEERARKLVQSLRRTGKYSGTDLAILQLHKDKLEQSLPMLPFLGFVCGALFVQGSDMLTTIVAVLLGVGFAIYVISRIRSCSSAIALLISKDAFNLQ